MRDSDKSPPNDDYRRSHLKKGADYDADLAALPFDRYMAVQEARLIDRLLDRHFPAGIPAYLDFACGTGRITSQVETRAQASYGVDVSEQMVAEAKRKCRRTTFLLQDITRQPLALRDVDLVTSFRFFGNAQDALRKDVLTALHSVLRPGGYLLINNHRNSLSLRNLLLRATGQSTDGELGYFKLSGLLKAAGFQIVATRAVGTWVFRSSLATDRRLNSPWAGRLEQLSRTPFVSPISPDVVILARRR